MAKKKEEEVVIDEVAVEQTVEDTVTKKDIQQSIIEKIGFNPDEYFYSYVLEDPLHPRNGEKVPGYTEQYKNANLGELVTLESFPELYEIFTQVIPKEHKVLYFVNTRNAGPTGYPVSVVIPLSKTKRDGEELRHLKSDRSVFFLANLNNIQEAREYITQKLQPVVDKLKNL